MANFDLSKLTEGKNPQSVMLEETRGLKTKWEQTGLLEGLKERDSHQMAVLLENQAKQLLDEANATSTSSGNEEWNGVALPLVRRIFGEISAKNFVSVQPMNLPSGLIFYLDFKYGKTTAGEEGEGPGGAAGGGGPVDAGREGGPGHLPRRAVRPRQADAYRPHGIQPGNSAGKNPRTECTRLIGTPVLSIWV